MKPMRYDARGAKKPAMKNVNSAGGAKKNWM